MKEELGISLEKATEDVLGTAAKVGVAAKEGLGAGKVLGTAAKVGAQMLTRKAVPLNPGHCLRGELFERALSWLSPGYDRSAPHPQVVISKESCTIVGDGSTQREVEARVKQVRHLGVNCGTPLYDPATHYPMLTLLPMSRPVCTPPPAPPNQSAPSSLQVRNLVENTEQEYEREKLNERIARLSGGVAIIQVGAQTETELKEKKLRVEDALNATKAAVEEGIVIGGGCTLLKLAAKVEAIKATLDNDEQKVGADIIRKALAYPLRLIASNAGVNGSVVMQKVLENSTAVPNYGYNASNDTYQDLMESGIIDPTKVVRCTLENAVSVAKTFLLADVVVTEIPERSPAAAAPAGGPGGDYGDY